jgi:hypothetical protein
MKGEFAKGPGLSIKEDMWQALKVLGKGPKYFDPSIQLDRGHRFQKDWVVDLSEGDISPFHEPGIRKTENRGTACIMIPRIVKVGSALMLST